MRRLGVLVAAVLAMLVVPVPVWADETRSGQWYLDEFDITSVHELSQGAGVRIGVIDSGVDATHPDLEGNVEQGAEFDADGQIDGNGQTDTDGHGTGVATVLAGHGHGNDNTQGILGIAPKATIIPAKVHLREGMSMGSGAIGQALQWMVDQDVDIISLSVSTGSDPIGQDAVQAAVDKGISVVVAAGNTLVDTGDWGGVKEQSEVGWPAREDGVIPVTGVNTSRKFWDYSVDLAEASVDPELGVSAPAQSIPVGRPDGGYGTVEGTSLAAPIVAGALALIESGFPTVDADLRHERLLGTADDKGDNGYDDKYGWGLLNPFASLTEEVSHTTPDGTTVSKPDDIVPLADQGKDPDPSPTTPTDPAPTDTTLTAAPTSGIPPWSWLAAAAILALAVAMLLKVHRKALRRDSTPESR